MSERPLTIPVSGGALAGHRGGSGPPALLLHGGPALPDYMDGCAAELHPHLDVIRYTQRGVAPSLVEGPYSVESHAADALAVLDALGIERAWAVGHSWGGHLALHLLVAHPERLLGAICIDPLGADGAIFGEFGANLRRHLSPAEIALIDEAEELRRRGEATEAHLVERMRIFWPSYFADPAAVPPCPIAGLGVECSTETNASLMRHFEARTLADGLPRVRLPVLFVHGELDPLPPRSSTDTAKLVPGARVDLVSGCGHFPWLERPGALAESVSAFLAAHR